MYSLIKDYENCKKWTAKKCFNWTWILLDFVLFLCQYFLHNLVKYCSVFKILDNFEQPMERAVEKRPRSKSSMNYRPRNSRIKSVKSFVGHPVITIGLQRACWFQPEWIDAMKKFASGIQNSWILLKRPLQIGLLYNIKIITNFTPNSHQCFLSCLFEVPLPSLRQFFLEIVPTGPLDIQVWMNDQIKMVSD